MAQNPFTRFRDFVDPPKRNVFDLSFQNNLTMNFGYLYPVFCKEVLPGDSFRIKPTFALNFKPLVFPIQTRMRGYLHFFYVRNRNLWKDWTDFIYNNKQGLVPPYIDFDKAPQTSSIFDYFGLPTTFGGKFGSSSESKQPVTFDSDPYQVSVADAYAFAPSYVQVTNTNIYQTLLKLPSSYKPVKIPVSDTQDLNALTLQTGYFCWSVQLAVTDEQAQSKDTYLELYYKVNKKFATWTSSFDYRSWLLNSCYVCVRTSSQTSRYYESVYKLQDLLPEISLNSSSDGSIDSYKIVIKAPFIYGLLSKSTQVDFVVSNGNRPNGVDFRYSVLYPAKTGGAGAQLGSNLGSVSLKTGSYSLVQPLAENTSPYYSSRNANKDKQIRISALPFRAYESIYNCYYRDSRNNPLIINGQPEYNKYLRSTDGGADTNYYKLYRKNWETDFLTSAVQSPQQGIAPLVGITSTGEFTFQDENGTYKAKATFAEDGETITSFSIGNSGMPDGNLRSLMDMASSGISINDLRNVNSLQRWLETNLRKGLRYKDQTLAHFGVDISFEELDMPEFIGGTTQPVMVNQVNQMAQSSDAVLGDYAGQASAIGTSNSEIDKYCDEHGFIIGIFSVIPTPVYSQLLPKHFIKDNCLDYYSPEFGHISMQPILQREVTPVQAFNAGTMNDVFGYQRPWYDYLASTDEVHGEFRTTLRNFLMNRVFDSSPELSEDFLLVDPEQLNDVFSVTGTSTDKIMGQIYFEVTKKTSIPLVGIPRLE